ncbi:TPA: bacteriocin [Vibrio vulnificus]|nr:bacteriocin [Vibrio vulnificus]
MMSYSLLSLGADTRKRALAGLKESAAREEERDQVNKNIEQAEKQQTLSAVGTGAAIGTYVMPGWGTAIGAGVGYIVGELF